MFDASLHPADALQQLTYLRRRLIENELLKLRRLGHARDIELLFSNGYCRPDWSLAEVLGEDVDKIVREIFDLGHDIWRGRIDGSKMRFYNFSLRGRRTAAGQPSSPAAATIRARPYSSWTLASASPISTNR